MDLNFDNYPIIELFGVHWPAFAGLGLGFRGLNMLGERLCAFAGYIIVEIATALCQPSRLLSATLRNKSRNKYSGFYVDLPIPQILLRLQVSPPPRRPTMRAMSALALLDGIARFLQVGSMLGFTGWRVIMFPSPEPSKPLATLGCSTVVDRSEVPNHFS